MKNSSSNLKTEVKFNNITRIVLLLLLPYIIWLSKYDDTYVKTIHNKVMHLNFDGVMLFFHNLFSSINILVHEAGHGVCYIIPCPQFLTALNGTLFQLAIPILFIYSFYKRNNFFLVGLGFIWLAQNLIYVAWYMSYANNPKLYPSFLGEGTHDFWYIFSQLGILEYDWFISGLVRAIAIILLFGSYFYLLFLTFIKKSL